MQTAYSTLKNEASGRSAYREAWDYLQPRSSGVVAPASSAVLSVHTYL
ncbi:hypothetical protein [Paenibacillus taiwanensis]|nr:hypothetical protein [Paenibacillus taiwanensis]